MTLFRNKYRMESARLKDWDYAGAGWYFVTICTRERECVLGDVIDGEVRLSPVGEIVADEWQRTPLIRPNVMLDAWVVMPNHLHGIIVLQYAAVETPRRGVSGPDGVIETRAWGEGKTPRRGVSTGSRLKSNSLGSIIGQFKSVATKRIRAAGYPSFQWQERFYDHIVRDERVTDKIREYVAGNAAKWQDDKNNPVNLWM